VQDAFAIQEEIARAVVAALRVRVPTDEAGRLRRSGTTNPQAYELYVRGLRSSRAAGVESGELARQLYKRAIGLDAAFPQPHAGISNVNFLRLQWLLDPKEAQPALREEALAESEEALRLDPDLPEAHVARANILALLGRSAEADQSFRRATALGPGLRDAWYYYGRFLFAAHRDVEAAQSWEEAARLDPDDYVSVLLAGGAYASLGEKAKNAGALRRGVGAADRALRDAPDDERALYMSGIALMTLGEVAKGRERLDQAVALKPHTYAVLYNAACGFARAGETAKALDLLDRAVGTGQGFRAWIEHDPDLDSLRGDPRFKQILARLPP
jgi:adenylate cyclase